MAIEPNQIKILDAAEKIMSNKGLSNSSIAEIAKNAGVTDSVIYRFFKGKEDLLFSIAGTRMKDILKYLDEHLQGISDPESRLRKMIWFHLYYNDTYREYARLLLLQCRSNKNFYQHNAYSLIRQYAGILLGILDDGFKRQDFRPDLNMRLVRDMIFGLLDWENLGCLAAKETEDTVSDLEDIMALITPIISIKTMPFDTKIDKSDKIIRAAESVFAESGYHQATIAQIARRSGVAEGTVYEYFENKEHLLLSIPELRFKTHIDRLSEAFEIRNPVKKLKRLIRYHFLLYLTEPDFLKVFLLHIQLNPLFYTSHAHETFREYSNLFEQIIEEGKKDGSIRSDVNTRVSKNLFFGAFCHMALRWLILDEKTKPDKYAEIDQVTSLLTRAVSS